jgi:hypothetical protein
MFLNVTEDGALKAESLKSWKEQTIWKVNKMLVNHIANYLKQSLAIETNSCSTVQVISSSFTESEGSLPCSQELAIISYSEPV